MGKKKKKRKKNKSQRPPLSLLDKAVYFVLSCLCAILAVGIYICTFFIRNRIVFGDTEVVAYSCHLSEVFSLPVFFYIFASALILFCIGYEYKIPVFGNRKIKYGNEPWERNFYPLFDSRRKIRPSDKSFYRWLAKVWITGLVVCIALIPFSLFGRDCLKEDNSIVSYNIVNVQKDIRYKADDFEHLTIRTSYSSRGYRSVYRYYRYEITIDMKDGESFSFSSSEFVNNKEDYHKNCIYRMLKIKSLFPSEHITIKGEEDLQKVIDDTGMNEEQIKLLNQLFS